MKQELLFAITFVLGVVALLSYTKLFNTSLDTFLENTLLRPRTRKKTMNEPSRARYFIAKLDRVIMFLSLMYQSWYWFIKTLNF